MSYKVIFSNELYHHGIKGQKWGVRRFQNEDGSLTPEGRKRYERELSEVSVIKKGSRLYRSTVNAKEETKGNKYMTYFDTDRNFYRGEGGEWIKDTGRSNKLYENTYVTNKDLKIATGKEVLKAYEELSAKDKKMVNESARAYVAFMVNNADIRSAEAEKALNDNRNKKKLTDADTADLYRKIYELDPKKWDDKACMEAMNKTGMTWQIQSLQMEYNERYNEAVHYIKQSSNMPAKVFYAADGWGTPQGQAQKERVINYLKSKGYHGMTDIAGVAGVKTKNDSRRRETRQAMIIFDTENNVSKKAQSVINGFTAMRADSAWWKWQQKLADAPSYVLDYEKEGR